MTQILALALLNFDMIVGNNEDWLDSWAYLDASGNPISLAGLVLNFEVRSQAIDLNLPVFASSGSSINGLPINGSVIVGGAGNNVVALQIPRATMLRVGEGSYVHEMQAVGDGVTRTIARGNVTVMQGVVR